MFFLRKRIDNAIYLLSKIETNENNNNDRVSKRSRVTTSKVWVNFIRIGVKDAKENVTCNHHGQEYVGGGGTKVWTLTMSCHLPKCDVLRKYNKCKQEKRKNVCVQIFNLSQKV